MNKKITSITCVTLPMSAAEREKLFAGWKKAVKRAMKWEDDE
jgi:glycerol kinase